VTNVDDIRGAVTHLRNLNEAVQLQVSAQLDVLDELHQLHAILEEESDNPLFGEMGQALIQARAKLVEALQTLDQYEDKAIEYLGIL
jgi:hypothetical protein